MTYTWNEINDALHIRMGCSPKVCLIVMNCLKSAYGKGRNDWSWKEINDALYYNRGWKVTRLMTLLKALKNTKK